MFVVFDYIKNKNIVYVKLFNLGVSNVVAYLSQNKLYQFMEIRPIERETCLKYYFGLNDQEIYDLFAYKKIEKKVYEVKYFVSKLAEFFQIQIAFKTTEHAQLIIFSKITYNTNTKNYMLKRLENSRDNNYYWDTKRFERIKEVFKQIFNFELDKDAIDFFESKIVASLFLKEN